VRRDVLYDRGRDFDVRIPKSTGTVFSWGIVNVTDSTVTDSGSSWGEGGGGTSNCVSTVNVTCPFENVKICSCGSIM